MLPSSFPRDHDRLRRFQLEAEAAAALNHPNILSIYHIGQQDQSGDCLQRHAGLYHAPSSRVARENPRTWGAPAGRDLLPRVGWVEVVASGSAERSSRGEQEAPGLETAPSAFDRPDPGGRVAGHYADRAALPQQTTVVDLQRFRRRGAQQRRSSGGERHHLKNSRTRVSREPDGHR